MLNFRITSTQLNNKLKRHFPVQLGISIEIKQ